MILNKFDKQMPYSILSWGLILFSNSTQLSKNNLILPYKIHFIPILVGRLIWKYKIQSQCSNNILDDSENKQRYHSNDIMIIEHSHSKRNFQLSKKTIYPTMKFDRNLYSFIVTKVYSMINHLSAMFDFHLIIISF
jgi:hypothetical protein